MRHPFLHLGIALAFAVVASGCGSDDTTTTAPAPTTSAAPATTLAPTTTASTSTTVEPTTLAPTTSGAPTTSAGPTTGAEVLVYGIRDEHLVALGREVAAATPAAAMQALIDGLTPDEEAAGIATMIPPDTALLGVTTDGSEITVDLSSVFGTGGGSLAITARVAQTVFTLTQFPGIETVRFAIDGTVVTDDSGGLTGEGVLVDHTSRLDWDGFIPLILLEQPVDGATVSQPIHVRGMSNTFEAVINYQVLAPDRSVLVEDFLMATSGTGTWGTFDADLVALPAGTTGQVIVRLFEYSAKDGTPVNVTESLVTLA